MVRGSPRGQGVRINARKNGRRKTVNQIDEGQDDLCPELSRNRDRKRMSLSCLKNFAMLSLSYFVMFGSMRVRMPMKNASRRDTRPMNSMVTPRLQVLSSSMCLQSEYICPPRHHVVAIISLLHKFPPPLRTPYFSASPYFITHFLWG